MFPRLREMESEATIRFINQRPYENALNLAARLTIEGGYDYLISFDHDNVPTKNPLPLTKLGKDIIGMPYPGFRYHDKLEIAFLAMDKQPNTEYLDHREMHGLQEVDAVASGAIVVSRRVLEHPDVFFTRKWERGNAVRGVDFHFCEKAKEAGFKVYAHYDYLADHIKEMSLLDVLNFHHG